MASLRPAFTQLRGWCQASASQRQQFRHMLQGLQISPRATHTRPLSTPPTNSEYPTTADDRAAKSKDDRQANLDKMISLLQDAEARAALAEDFRPATEPSAGPKQYAARRDEDEASSDRKVRDPEDAGISRTTATRAQLTRGRADAGISTAALTEPKLWRADPGSGTESDEQSDKPEAPPPIYARPVPVSPSYFSRKPVFNDNHILLRKMYRKFAHLPTAPPDQLPRLAYRSLKEYRATTGENIKATEFSTCMTLVKKLLSIHPDLRPATVKSATSAFLREISPHTQRFKPLPIDRFGRSLGVGRRKTSTARAWVVEGVGEVLVNGKSLADAFGRVHDRESAVWALKATARTDKYNVWALVGGGGTTGQAEALALAVGKALLAHEPALKPALRRAGVVTRDPRSVERKKPGRLKARKRPAWVKR